jgi:prepilin-type N-terminal cleavage/methylation domain-containing protein
MPTSTTGIVDSSQGFTLMELLVVMVLLSLTMSFAIPNIRSSLFGDDLHGLIRRFVGLVAETRQDARMQRTAFRLYYDQDQRIFRVSREGQESEEGQRRGNQLRLPDSVQLVDIQTSRSEGTEDAILFNHRGYVEKTLVRFRSDSGQEFSVLLSPFLGSIRIVEGSISLEDERIVLHP